MAAGQKMRVAAATALVLGLASQAYAAPSLIGAARADWSVSCREGGDEFASNCEAATTGDGLKVELATADSQVFLQISASGCSETTFANWFRDEVAFRSPKARRRLLVREFEKAQRQIVAACPGRAKVKLGAIPDIAAQGEPTDPVGWLEP